MIRAGTIGSPSFTFETWACTNADSLIRCSKGQGTTKRMTFRDVSPEVRLPDCSNSVFGGESEPVLWDAGCTGVPELDSMSWREWGKSSATGSGTTMLNDCSPSCAAGTVYTFAVTATVSRIRTCVDDRGRTGRFYTRVRYVYTMPEDHPLGRTPGEQEGTFELSCSQALPCSNAGNSFFPAYDIEARDATCVRARRVASDAQGTGVCRRENCVRQIRGLRCSFRPTVALPGGGGYQPVRCTSGSVRVTFRLTLD